MKLTKTIWTKLFAIGLGATMALGVGLTASKIADEVNAVNYAAEADFTLKSASHSNYGDSWTYGNWTLFGAANNNGGWAFMKFGGKSATLANANPVYCRGRIAKAVSQIDVVTNSGTLPKAGMDVTQWGVHVYSDADYSTLIDTVIGGTMTKLNSETLSLIPASSWPAGSYYDVFFNLTNTSSTNGIIWLDKIQFVEHVDVGKTLTDLALTGTPETTIYDEGDDFDTTGITVTATYSDTSTSDVTSQVIWEDLTVGMTSVEGSYTYLSSTLTVEVTGLTVNAAPAVGGIVDGHAYLITATDGTTTYVLKAGSAFTVGDSDLNTAVFASPANYSLADAYVFTNVGTNQYSITSGSNYLSANSTNNGLVLGTTSDSWTATVNTYGHNGIHLQDSNNSRYLTVYGSAPDFRTYASTSSQGNYAACIVLYDMTVLEGFASDFNTSIGGVCNSSGATNLPTLSSEWSDSAAAFNDLSTSQKAVYADTTNAVGDENGTPIQKALSKYTYVAAKYNTQLMASGWDFMGRNITPSGSANIDNTVAGNNNVSLAIIVISSLIGLSTIAGFYFLKKKRDILVS
jgi:hypothetical protein